jgi:hypothetical protein
MANQYWIKQKTGPAKTCGNLPVFRAIRYYFVTISLEIIDPQTSGKYLYNFYQTKKGRII